MKFSVVGSTPPELRFSGLIRAERWVLAELYATLQILWRKKLALKLISPEEAATIDDIIKNDNTDRISEFFVEDKPDVPGVRFNVAENDDGDSDRSDMKIDPQDWCSRQLAKTTGDSRPAKRRRGDDGPSLFSFYRPFFGFESGTWEAVF